MRYLTYANMIARELKELGVNRIYTYPGGTVAPLLDALMDEDIECICPRNEQGAGYAAIGAAKVTNQPRVVIVTSGPGATNLLSPVADAYYDSVPLLVFTGQVGTKDINYSKKIRQTGFQETDTTGIFSPVVKSAQIMEEDCDPVELIQNAYNLAKDGRPGPVLIDLPMDVQRKLYEPNNNNVSITKIINNSDFVCDYKINEVKQAIEMSQKPLILVGNGVLISRSVDLIRGLVNKFNIPVVSSLPGLGVIPFSSEKYLQFIGHTGEYYANLALYHSDLLVVFGSRLDLRQTGSELDEFRKNKKIIRVDIDQSELDHGRVKGDINICADIRNFFVAFNREVNEISIKQYNAWWDEIKEWKKKYDSSQFYQGNKLYSYDIIKGADALSIDQKVVVTTGVGSHQQMAARYFSYKYPERIFLSSCGHGTMGYDIPTVIGALMELPEDYIGIVFAGDGSFQMNIQELATIHEFNLPIKIFVLDNKRLGIVSQFQKLTWGRDPVTGHKVNPSFSKIGEAYGLKGFDISNKNEVATILKEVFNNNDPAVVHCHIDYDEDVLPMLLGGQKLSEMYPFSGK